MTDLLTFLHRLGDQGYRVRFVAEGSALVSRPARTTRTGWTDPARVYHVTAEACDCQAAQHGMADCRHRRIVREARPCDRPGCDGIQLFEDDVRPDGTEKNSYRCLTCGYLEPAERVAARRTSQKSSAA